MNKLDENLLSKLKQNNNGVDTVQSPIQMLVPVSESKRSGETQCIFWMDKRLKKAMQAEAIKGDTDLKTIFVSLAAKWCAERGVDWQNI